MRAERGVPGGGLQRHRYELQDNLEHPLTDDATAAWVTSAVYSGATYLVEPTLKPDLKASTCNPPFRYFYVFYGCLAQYKMSHSE